MTAVDTSVWINHLADRPTPEVAKLRAVIADGEAELVLCDTVLFEVLRGLRSDAQAARVERDLRRFPVEPVSPDADAAARAAARWRAMRAQGFTAGHADAQIASWCLDRGHRLLHADLAFYRMEALLGLLVEPA